MGQRVSSCFHPRFPCPSNSVYPNHRDYEKLKSQPDSVILQKHPQDCEKLKSKEKDSFYLQIHPQEIRSPFKLRKEELSFTVRLSNKSDNYVAFKVKGNAKKFFVDPYCIGVVRPRSTRDIIVTMQTEKKAPPNMHCIATFLIQRIVARPGATREDITSEMFYKESGYVVEESTLRAVYVAKSPTPVKEGSDVDSFRRASVFSEKERALISKLTKERNSAIKEKKRLQKEVAYMYEDMSKLAKERKSAIEQNKMLRQELKLLRREEECITQ